MVEAHHFPYGGAPHRITRAYIGITLTMGLGLVLVLWWAGRFVAAPLARQPLVGLALDSIILLGLASYLIWTSYLSLCNVFVTTASITLFPDRIELITRRGWRTEAAVDTIATARIFPVVYRLGARRSLLRIRKQPASALFIPVEHLTGHTRIYQIVARMYAGRSARYGFLVTPDHAHFEQLLEHLSVSKGGSDE